MGVQEIKDDFLLSMGCSISNRYNYINDDGYDYFAKLEEKDVKINNKNIPVRKAIGNTMLLNSDLAISGTQAMLKVAEEISSVNGNNDAIAKLGNFTMEVGKLYFTDWLKYATNKLKIDEQLLQYMISLITSAAGTLNDNVMEILNKYKINLSNAKMEARNWQTQRNAEIAAQNANAPKTTFATTYMYDSVFGNGQTGVTFATTKSTVTDGMLRGQFYSSSVVADIISKNRENSAYQKAIGEMGQVIENIILKFNEQLMELLVMKLPKLFSEDVLNNNRNLELNPTNADEWMKEIPELNDEELKELKKLNKFYGIGLKQPLEKRLVNDMCNYYAKESKTDFGNNDLKLYMLLTEKEEKVFPALSKKMYKYFYDKMYERNSWKATQNLKVAEKLWDDDKKKIKECEYLTEEDKKGLIKECDELVEFWVNKHKWKAGDVKRYRLFSLIGLILSPIVIYGFINIIKIFEWFDSVGIGISGLLILLVMACIPIATIYSIYTWLNERKEYKEWKKNN